MNRTVSVIIPAYNRENYIEECIGSVQCQSWQDFEILVVDDGSTDKTVEICTRMAQADPRIKLLASPHAGVSAARNKALDAATGAYLFFLDSDDVIHPCLLNGLLEQVQRHRAAMACTSGCDILNDIWGERILQELLRSTAFDNCEFLSNEELLQRFFKRKAVLGRMGGVLIARHHFSPVRFREDLHIGEDVCFIYEHILQGATAVIVKDKGYFWREHNTRISSGISFEAFLSRQVSKAFMWRTEEKFGRVQNANKEKMAAYKNFLAAQARNRAFSADNKKMRKAIKPYCREMFPALTKKQRFMFLMNIYTPGLYFGIRKIVIWSKRK